MSNANRDYAIVYDVKNSLLVLSRPLNFYLTDKNTSNIFVRLVTKVSVGNGIDQYTDIENATNYVLTMRVIKPDDEVKSLTATQHESESIFQFDLTEDFKDIPGKYICELTISNVVNGRQEFTTSDPFNYEVKRSILSNVKNIIEGKDTTVEKLLNRVDCAISLINGKPNKNEVFLIKDGININDFDEETRQTFLEQQGIDVNYILGKGNVKYENLAKNIKPDFLDGVKYLENLLDPSKFVIGGLNQDGTLNELVTGNYCSDFIPVLPNNKYYRLNTNTVVIGYYNENKVCVDRPTIANGINNFTIPSNVHYIRYTDYKESMLTEIISTVPMVEYNNYLNGKYVLSEKYKVLKEALSEHIMGEPEFLANGFDLNTLDRDGYFVCTNCINKPEISGVFFLINRVFLNNSDIGRWVIQEAYNFTDVLDRYMRVVDLENSESTSSWVSLKFSKELLGDHIMGEPEFLANGFDLNTLSKDGYFVCTSCTNKPAIDGVFFLVNRVFLNNSNTGRWVIQEVYNFTDVSDRYIRVVDLENSANNKDWIDISKAKSKFKGKKLITVGDSITEGVGASNKEVTYPGYLKNKYGLNVVNVGIAGATWANYNDGRDNISIIHQVDNTDFTDADFVTIFAGTNDFGRTNGDTIGNTTDTETNTVKGAMNYVFNKILTQNPRVKIAVITPMWRQRLASGDNKDSDTNTILGQYLIDYVKAIEEQAKYNHIPCLNLYETCLINKYNYSTYLSDGLHPNDKGYELLADKIHSFLESVY